MAGVYFYGIVAFIVMVGVIYNLYALKRDQREAGMAD